jgi:hypothetical protein
MWPLVSIMDRAAPSESCLVQVSIQFQSNHRTIIPYSIQFLVGITLLLFVTKIMTSSWRCSFLSTITCCFFSTFESTVHLPGNQITLIDPLTGRFIQCTLLRKFPTYTICELLDIRILENADTIVQVHGLTQGH